METQVLEYKSTSANILSGLQKKCVFIHLVTNNKYIKLTKLI